MSGSVKITLRILLLFTFYSVYSQTADTLISKIQTGKISGIVIDSKNSIPLIKAECKLYRNKDTIVHRISKTDSSGYFSIDSISFGKYWIEIESTGYGLYVNNKLQTDENKPAASLDTIRLVKQDIETEEILVEGEKPIFTFEGDKKIFNVTESISSSGGTALDVLRKVPMVDVDINDNVTLRGSTNVKILIDNKENKAGLNLKQLPAEGVDRVELITNPPAKYSSEGFTGIINIVMKKSDKLGFNGYSNIDVSSNDNYGGGLNLDFKKDKTTIFTNAFLSQQYNNGLFSGETQYFVPAVSYMNYNGNYSGKSYYGYITPGVEYDVMKNSVIGIECDYYAGKYNNTSNATTRYLNGSRNITSYYANPVTGDGNWSWFYLSGYMDLKFNEEGKDLSGNIDYLKNKNPNNSVIKRQYYDSLSQPVNNTPLLQNDTTNTVTTNMNVQLDYTHPFNKSSQIETGYKLTYRENDNDYHSDTLDYNQQSYVNNINLSNHFRHTEMINALYFMFGSKIKGFSFKLGLRVENTNTKSELLTGYQVNKRSYTNFFPTVNLSQRIGKSNQLQFGYSRRVTRPNAYRLNPFVNRSRPGYIYYGNPMLNPEFTDSYELSYMLFTKPVTVTPLIFFRRLHDVISSYGYTNDTGTTVITSKNATGANAYGMDFIVSSRSFEWMSLNATFSFYNTKFDEDLVTDYSAEEGFSWRANIRAYFSICKIFKLDVFYNYNGRKVNAQTINLPSQNLDFGLSINMFKEKATVRFSVSDIFKTQQWATNTNGIGFYSSSKNQYDSRMARMNISYRFGNTDEYYQKKKKMKKNENESIDSGDEGQKNK